MRDCFPEFLPEAVLGPSVSSPPPSPPVLVACNSLLLTNDFYQGVCRMWASSAVDVIVFVSAWAPGTTFVMAAFMLFCRWYAVD